MSVFITEFVDIGGKRWRLKEISARQRLEFLRYFEAHAKPENGFQILAENVRISALLVEMHLRRACVPRWYTRWRVKRLPDRVLGQLYRECVRVSNLPILKDNDQETSQSDDQEDD